MSERHVVSRRAGLKRLGAAGAALVVGGAALPLAGQEAKPAERGTRNVQDKPAPNAADVATGRMAKGHS
jgi:hypothetical protein